MSDSFEACIAVARAELEAARQLLQQDIITYPSPISGCDAQFNHMLAERQKVLSALSALSETVFVPTPRSPTVESEVESR
ncbi:MAG: hypothetical protein AAF340_00035 [Pseudomonadota bacterium]